jgi:hypothetical protein
MSRRSPGRWAVLFTSVFVLINVATWSLEPQIEAARSRGNPGSLLRARQLLDSGPAPNIVFMGSSLTALGFDPKVAESEIAQADGVSTRALNLGIFLGDVDINYLVLKNLISDDRKPAAIVYGITDFELNSSLPDSKTRQAELSPLLAMDDIGDFSGDGLPSKIDFIVSRVLPIYRDGDLIRKDLGLEVLPEPFGIPETDQGNFPTPKGRFLAREWPNPHVKDPLLGQPYQFDGHRLDRLHAFLDLARSRGIQVVLVNMPVAALRRTYWQSPADMRRYVDMVQSAARDAGTPLLDLYEDRDRRIPPEAYLDGYHLNAVGSRILTTLVAREYLAPLFRQH